MRPPLAEVEAIQRICLFARETGARLYLPHVSSAAALHAAVEQRAKGTQVHIETCPQYLLSGLTADAQALAKVNPPVRIDEEGTELWKAVRNGDVDTVGTDHACWCQVNKRAASIRDVSPGFPGLGTLLPLMMDSIAAGRMTVADLVRLNSRAADLFQLPEHGRIAPGCAADLVVVDPAMKKEVDAKEISGGSDFSPWQGRTLQGWPVLTIQRGRVIARDGDLTGDPGGRYLRTSYQQGQWAAA
jgi:dihydroorotase-like cyclic amidohydrolase